MGPAGGAIVAQALSANAEKCANEGKESSLRVLVCGRNRLENGSAPAWGEAFAKHKGLRSVRMIQNGIRMEGIKAIVEGLAANKTLEVLDLQDNTATKVGTRSIVRQLPNWPELKELNLSDCLVGSAGGIALATALANGSNTKLEKLQLQYGEFDKRTVELLATAITQHLSELTVLELNGNKFAEDDECVEELKKALAVHGHEDALDERKCDAAEAGARVGAEADGQWTTWRRSTRTRRKRRATRMRMRTRTRTTALPRARMARRNCQRRLTKMPMSERDPQNPKVRKAYDQPRRHARRCQHQQVEPDFFNWL